VHVYVPPFLDTRVRGAPLYDPAVDDEGRARWRAYLDRVAGRVGGQGVAVSTAVLQGPPFETLQPFVAASGADLVVMSTHGHGSPSRSWLGSLTDRMLRTATVPLLLVRPRAGAPDPTGKPGLERMLVTLDGSEFAERVLAPAGELARLLGLDLTLLRVAVPIPTDPRPDLLPEHRFDRALLERERAEAEAYLAGTAERLRGEGLRVATAVADHPRPAVAILELAAELGADVIALSTHGRGGVRRLLLGSVADKVLRSASGALLVLRPTGD
jgi:nucleotide-binding universal stress UspA family protein